MTMTVIGPRRGVEGQNDSEIVRGLRGCGKGQRSKVLKAEWRAAEGRSVTDKGVVVHESQGILCMILIRYRDQK